MPQPIRTLIVDDSIYIRRALCVMLDGYERISIVGTAGSGLAALEEVERLRPDLVLMDIQMPQMNGLEATAHILRQFPPTRVIIVTCDDSVEARKASMACGANGFVSKGRIYVELCFEIARVFGDVEVSRVERTGLAPALG